MPFFQPLANLMPPLPGLAGMAGSLQTYAPWPVWRDSTTAEVRFMPLAKKKAVQYWHKAREFERRTRKPGCQDGALGRNGLAVLQTLLFDFLNHASGRLDPSQSAIARKACISLRSVTRGLANLKLAGVLFWLRRAAETRDEYGRFCLEQDTNAYAVLPPSQWLGFIDRPTAPPPHPATWGATPPLPSVLEQAAEEQRGGGNREAVIKRLEADPGDELAAALAGLGRLIEAEARKSL